MDLTPKAKIVTRGEAAETPPEVAVTPETPTPMLEVGTINGDGEDDQQIRGEWSFPVLVYQVYYVHWTPI